MSIMAAYAQSDARGAAWLLAAAAKKCISDAAAALGNEHSLNNAYRLLESYRANTFYGSSEPARQYERGGLELLPLIPSTERHIAEVRGALEQALDTVFAGVPKDAAIDRIESVLRSVAYPAKFNRSADSDKELTEAFFDELLKRLQIR